MNQLSVKEPTVMPIIQGTTTPNFSTSGSVTLEHFACPGKFDCSGSAVLHSSQLNEARVSGSAKFTLTTANHISASGCLDATDCKFGSVNASGSCFLSQCAVLNELETAGSLNLTASKVHGKVTCFGKAAIFDSVIDTCLEVSSRLIQVKNSSVKEIVVKPCNRSSSFSIFGFSYHSQDRSPQKVELDGTNCKVGTIRFDTPDPGVVVLKNGAPAPTIINGQILAR